MFRLSEQELEHRSICSWRPPEKEGILQGPLFQSLRWAILERFGGVLPTLDELCAKFLQNWHRVWGDRPRGGQDYWIGPKTSRTFGARVYTFLLSHEVLQPYEPYELPFKDGVVYGSAALVEHKRSHDKVPLVLAVHLQAPQGYRQTQLPDYGSLAQWLAVRQKFEGPTLGITHLPLLRGKPWKHSDIHEALARQWVGSILTQAVNDVRFPQPGTHCHQCSHPCKEITCGQDDHRWD